MASIIKVDSILDSNGNAFDGSQLANVGKVLQTVQYFRHGYGNLSGNSSVIVLSSGAGFTNIFSKSITTTQDNSKILVNVSCVGYSGGAALRGTTQLLRNSTMIAYDRYGFYADVATMQTNTFEVLDMPNVPAGTTITYYYQASSAGGGTYVINYGDGGGGANGNLTLTEIGA